MNYYVACFWFGCASSYFVTGHWKAGLVFAIIAVIAVIWSLGFRVRRA